MKNFRLPLAALLALFGLGILLHGELARATLTLDPAFGTGGVAQVDVADAVDGAQDIAAQSDGALVLVGGSQQTVVDVGIIDRVALTRLNGTTGAVDTTFGTDGNGIVLFLPGGAAAIGGGGDGRALAIQPDQKIIVAGNWDANQGGGAQLFVARFDSNGVPDPSFNPGSVNVGVVLFTPAGVTSPSANAIVLRSDGSIIVVGNATVGDGAAAASVGFITGLTSTGATIPGFTDTIVPNPLPTGTDFGFNAVALLSGDRILAAGGGGDLTLAQFTSSGVLDAGFNGDGIATYNYIVFDTAEGPSETFDVATALVVLDDGRILIAGRSATEASSPANTRTLSRVTASGSLDPSFGSGGFAPLPFFSDEEVPDGLGVGPSGDIVLVGQGFVPTQVSPNGITVSEFSGDLPAVLTDLEVLGGGDVVASGRTGAGGDSAFAAVRLSATDLPDGEDTVPNPFSFPAKSGVELGAITTSDAVTITGIGAAITSPVSVIGGEYSIGCTGAFTTADATISNGQTVCVRGPASQLGSTAALVLLDIGGVEGLFTIVTGDATPDQFTFVDQTGVASNAEITSAPITLTGLTIETDVAVSGGLYSVGCTGTFTSQVTRAAPGAQICVRQTSSTSLGGTVDTTLTVGAGTEIQDTFTSTTAGDITPDAFSFAPQTNVAKSTVIQSNTVTLTGFTSNSPVTVTGGEYSIGCTGTFRSTASTVAPNSTVCVRQTSSAAGGTATTATLTVGAGTGLVGVSSPFTITTTGTQDTTPDSFSFPDQTNVPLATVITSGAITIGGFDTAAPISVTGGTYSVGCGTVFTANPGTLAPNSAVCVRQTSAVTGGTATATVLTVGGVSDTFTSTTLPGDAVPTDFSFADQTGVDLFATITSAPVTITGIDIASPISVTGGEYSIGCTSTFVTAAANISNGQTVCVRQRSSFNSETSVSTTLTISTFSAVFMSTTKSGDQTPDDFSFTSQVDVALDTLITSNTITITGVDSPVRVLLSGRPGFTGFSVGCTGEFDGESGEVLQPGATLCVGAISAATDSSSVVVTVTIGGDTAGSQTSATFTVTTGETVPDPFTFTDQVGVLLGETVYANPITITGITAPSRVEISQNSQYQINCTGSFTRDAGVVSNNETICVRQLAANSLSTLTDTVLTVGGVSDTFTSTTVVDKPLPGGSAMDVWALGLLVPLVAYRRRRSAFRRSYTPWHFLNFLPLPQKQGSLRPSFGVSRR